MTIIYIYIYKIHVQIRIYSYMMDYMHNKTKQRPNMKILHMMSLGNNIA